MKYPKRVFTFRYRGAQSLDEPDGIVVVVARVIGSAWLAARRVIGATGRLEMVSEEPLRDPMQNGAQVVYHHQGGT